MPLYDAFISYSHAKDKPIAAALQSVVQKLGKAWYQRRAARVFRDDTSLSATPHLWPSIETALSASNHLILLASPEAASSPWIIKEVEYWLEHKSPETLFIGLTAGDLTWDSKTGDFSWSTETPLPAALKSRFANEPKWVDLRAYRDGADSRDTKLVDLGADFAAAIRGVPKEDLMSEEVRQQRRTRQIATAAAATLFVFAVVAGWQWRVAEAERALKAEQLRQAQVNESRYLVARAREAANDNSTDLAKVLVSRSLPKNLADPDRPLIRSGTDVLANILTLDTLKAILIGHTNLINSAAFSPDGTRIVTASDDKTARIWDAATGAPLQTLKGDEAGVLDAAFSPDGKRVVTSSHYIDDDRNFIGDGGTARIWNAETGALLQELKGHKDYIASAVFSPDGKLVLTASGDHTARLWDADTGHLLRLFEGQDNLRGALFSPDGKWVLTASRNDTAALWEVGTGKQLQLFQGADDQGRRGLARLTDTGDFSYTDGVNTAVFSPDGKLILTATGVGNVRIFDAATGAAVRELLGHTGAVKTARFSPDGGRVVTASSDRTARIWDANTGELLFVLEGHKDALSDAIFSPDGKLVLTGSYDNTARVWNAETGRLMQVLRGLPDADKWYFVSSIAFSPDGESILAGGREGWDARVRIWKARAPQSAVILRGHEGGVNFGAFSPDGKVIVTASDDKTARVWDAASAETLHVLKGHEDSVIRAQFDPTGKRILTSSSDATAGLWNAATGEQLQTLKGHSRPVNAADFSPDGSAVVTASSDNTARLWKADGGELLHVLRGHEHDVTTTDQGQMTIALNELGKAMTGNDNFKTSSEEKEGQLTTAAFSPDGTRVVTASTDGTARLWDFATGKTLAVLRGHDAWVVSAAFSRDGKLLVTTSSEPKMVARGNVTARIWDANTGQQLHVLRGHQGNVNDAAFSPGGELVLTASSDGTARLWSAATGELLQVLEGGEAPLTAVAFSPDGTRMLSAGGDGTARVWDTATGELLRMLAGHEDAILSASFSPDGTHVLTTSNDGTARLWEAPPPLSVLIAYLRASISQPISAEDRKRLGLGDQGSPLAYGVSGTPRERCNALAGNPSDPKALGPGTAFRLIDYFAAIPSCEEAVAENPGDGQLLYQLGRAFERGYNEERNFKTKRAETFERGFETNYRAAAALGYPQALYVMANIEKSPEQALKLLERAHEVGVIEAAGQLSDHYAKGEGLPPDYPKARRWLEIGADEGDPLANNQLGLLYWEGSNEFGIEKDWNRALFHFSLAARLFDGSNYDNTLGETRATLYRANLARRLPIEKVAELWQRAQDWKPGGTLSEISPHNGGLH